MRNGSTIRGPMRGAVRMGALALLLGIPAASSAQEAEKADFAKSVGAAVGGGLSDGDAAGRLGSKRMRSANRMAGEILERRMKQRRPDDLKLIRQAGAADIVVVRGSYDRVQDVLRAVKVKHVVIPPRLLARIPLMSTQTLMINCPGRIGRAAQAKVKRFVKTGGYLVTTDWALSAVQRMFPGFIARGGRNTQNDVVKVSFADQSDSLLDHVRAAKAAPRWWLEASSYPIRVVNPKKVKVLIGSKEMRRKYGHAPIAVAFQFDDGHVLHMTSHFYLQQAKLNGRRERAKGSSFARSAGLKGAELEALRKRGLDKVESGALNSAYSMQQVTANVVVRKAKANRKLLQRYKRRAKRGITLEPSAAPSSSASTRTKSAAVRKGYILRELDRRGKRVKVRDLFGREGWTDANALE